LIVCFASIALADDFKTINGKEYKNATVSRVDPDGIVLRSKSGIVKVYFAELPKEGAGTLPLPTRERRRTSRAATRERR
jgi:hypothetical protein